jgi:hypothetical protein
MCPPQDLEGRTYPQLYLITWKSPLTRLLDSAMQIREGLDPLQGTQISFSFVQP